MSEMLLAVGISFGSVALLGPFLIPKLRELKFGQSIRELGPQSHLAKAGTPTMGGILILIGFLSSVLFLQHFTLKTAIITLGLLLFGLVGFLDDYIKIVMKRNLGLRAYQKIIFQTVFSLILGYLGYLLGPYVLIPFTQQTFDMGLMYIPFMWVVFLAVTNAVNLTDGLDGLASSVSIMTALFFVAASLKLAETDTLLATLALIGGCLGFLLFNKYPAKVFMGDTGSLALGGAFGAIAMVLHMQIYLIFVGLIFVVETLSVILQVGSYKLRKKRIFKMAPLHHHFELSGWKETKVVAVFACVAACASVLGYLVLL